MDIEKEINSIKQRLDNLTQAFIQSQHNNCSVVEKADDSSVQIPFIEEQMSIGSKGISENDSAICDVADLSDVNSQAIDDLAEMVDELSNRVAELEG